MNKSTLILIFCIFSGYSIFAQTENVAGKIPIRTTILSDDSGPYNIIVAGNDSDCLIKLEFPFYVTNLERFSINSGRDRERDLFDIPLSRPEMIVNYNIDATTGSIPLTSFKFHGIASTKENVHTNIYVSYAKVAVDVSRICSNDDDGHMTYSLSLVTQEPYSSGGGQMVDVPYSFCNFTGPNDIFQSEIFPDLPLLCNSNLEYGEIHIDCSEYCVIESDPIIEMRTIEKNNFTPEVSPNPFNSIINLKFSPEESNIINSIEVYNIVGTLVHSINNLDLGNNENYTLDLSHLQSGVYFLITNGINQRNTVRLLKQ